MLNKVLILLGVLFIAGGCATEPMPQIDYGMSPESPVIIPPAVKPKPKQGWQGTASGEWKPASVMERKWTAVVIHHSATPNGNSAIIDRWHREGNHWDGIGYDFVIGNGSDSRDGEVEPTFRWQEQRAGAHCGGTAGNWANEYGVGICLIGNFNQTRPTSRQMASLNRLVKFLQSRYGISNSRVYGHRNVPGGRKTDCPGRYFPMSEFKSKL